MAATAAANAATPSPTSTRPASPRNSFPLVEEALAVALDTCNVVVFVFCDFVDVVLLVVFAGVVFPVSVCLVVLVLVVICSVGVICPTFVFVTVVLPTVAFVVVTTTTDFSVLTAVVVAGAAGITRSTPQ